MSSASKKLPLWATLFTVLGVVVLFSLSAWQFYRLSWKADIIAKLDAAYAGEVSAPLDLDMPFSYGFVDGIFLSDEAFLLGPRVRDDAMGFEVVVPLALKDGQTLLVNMGWTAHSDPKDVPIHALDNKALSFTGLLRAPEWNSFTPENDPDKEVWYKLDPLGIGAAKGLAKMVPYVLYAEKSSHEFGEDLPHAERVYPNNNHLQYALFWMFMGFALIGVYYFRFLRN